MLAIQLSYYQVSQTFVVLHKQNIYHFFFKFYAFDKCEIHRQLGQLLALSQIQMI